LIYRRLDAAPKPDFYTILGVKPDANNHEIKRAYHNTLLSLHPDRKGHHTAPIKSQFHSAVTFDASLVKEAYITLTTPELRKSYDISVYALRYEPKDLRKPHNASRPAQVVSLEAFDEVPLETVKQEGVEEWVYSCRCGSTYRINEEQLESDVHIVGCEGCSEVVWVGYEQVDENEEAK